MIMRDKLTTIKGFSDVETQGDANRLLKEIRTIILQIKTNTSIYTALDEATALYHEYRQEKEESNAKQIHNFKSIVAAVEHLGGTIFADDALVKMDQEKDVKKGISSQDNEVNKKVVRIKGLGVDF